MAALGVYGKSRTISRQYQALGRIGQLLELKFKVASVLPLQDPL